MRIKDSRVIIVTNKLRSGICNTSTMKGANNPAGIRKRIDVFRYILLSLSEGSSNPIQNGNEINIENNKSNILNCFSSHAYLVISKTYEYKAIKKFARISHVTNCECENLVVIASKFLILLNIDSPEYN